MDPKLAFEMMVDQKLSDEALRAWASSAFHVPETDVSLGEVDETFERPVSYESPINIVRSFERGPPPQYQIEVVYPMAMGPRSYAREVALVGLLAESARCRIMMSDETNNPYQWIFFDGSAVPQWVWVDAEALDERELLFASQPVRDEWRGSLFTKEALDERLVRAVVKRTFGAADESIQVEQWVAPECASPEERQYPVVDEVHFRHGSSVCLSSEGPVTWTAQATRAQEWVERMRELRRETDAPYVLCHPAFETIVNFRGGSDTEWRCVVIDGEVERSVVYRTRRSRW